MPFFVGSRDACRLAGCAVTLVAGACAAFAVPACAGLWPHFAYLATVVFLAAWGRGARGLRLPALFVLGALAAFRADDARARVLAANARLGGDRPVLALEVEGDVREWTRKRDGAALVSFAAHAGPVRLSVVMPVHFLYNAYNSSTDIMVSNYFPVEPNPPLLRSVSSSSSVISISGIITGITTS